MTELLFIVGAQKTGSSTLAGILNCDDNIYIMMEFFKNKKITWRGKKLLEQYKIPKEKFIKKKTSVEQLYYFLYKYMKNINIKKKWATYKYFGDKWVGLWSDRNTTKIVKELSPHKCIFIIRDIETWLCHKSIINMYGADKDVIIPSIYYTSMLIKSFLLPSCLRIKTNDLFNEKQLLKKIEGFLNIDTSCMKEWWNKIGTHDDFNKNIYKWWNNHPSSLVKPQKLDITIELQDHIFWKTILPIFYKYYDNLDFNFKEEEIINDVRKINSLKEMGKVELKDCYSKIQYEEIGKV